MGKIVIPKRFRDQLSAGSYVHTLCSNAEILYDLPVTYFSEYTLHEESHVKAVLDFAEKLIPQKTQLSEDAVAMLVAAIVVHDLGMFLQYDGLQELLFGAYADRKTEHLDKLTWREAWQAFYSDARRWGDRQLIEVFGNSAPVEHGLRDHLPPKDQMTPRHKMFYGEFLRRHHHRLAHDIALHGFFGNEQIDVFKNCNCDEFTKDMIGLIARSHGMAVRDTEEYLKHQRQCAGRAEPRGIPVYYLMILLRLADYLHAGKSRASLEREKADALLSPVSHREFAWNQAVYDKIDFFRNKKEIYVEADPGDSKVYLSLESWLYAVQKELDMGWALLAEYYADKYELTVHRVKTNIFDENALAVYNQAFLTRKAMLGANPDIVKHLVAPLYGDDPSYGVRELIQNAVDACNERTALDGTEGKITVDVNTETGTFTITDNGIGMNEDVLVNYYLVAGASYRNSPAWAEHFKDEDNNPTIARSGRFGIGALATFLIGERATVTTRHMDDALGYQFTYGLESRRCWRLCGWSVRWGLGWRLG
jgi:hypothetical protein